MLQERQNLLFIGIHLIAWFPALLTCSVGRATIMSNVACLDEKTVVSRDWDLQLRAKEKILLSSIIKLTNSRAGNTSWSKTWIKFVVVDHRAAFPAHNPGVHKQWNVDCFKVVQTLLSLKCKYRNTKNVWFQKNKSCLLLSQKRNEI